MIQYIAEKIELLNLSKKKINRWIKETAAVYGKSIGEIAYIFCTDDRILEVNKQYLNHDFFTDIITFDNSDGSRISGDILISLDTVKSNAEEFRVSYEDELKRIIIHGILHLCGQDDKTPELRLEMTGKEDLALGMYRE